MKLNKFINDEHIQKLRSQKQSINPVDPFDGLCRLGADRYPQGTVDQNQDRNQDLYGPYHSVGSNPGYLSLHTKERLEMIKKQRQAKIDRAKAERMQK